MKNYDEVIGYRMETNRLKNDLISLEIETIRERGKYNQSKSNRKHNGIIRCRY